MTENPSLPRLCIVIGESWLFRVVFGYKRGSKYKETSL